MFSTATPMYRELQDSCLVDVAGLEASCCIYDASRSLAQLSVAVGTMMEYPFIAAFVSENTTFDCSLMQLTVT